MEASTTIRDMLKGNHIFVPDYQRAYSWDIGSPSDSSRQVNQFLEDIEEYINSKTKSPYYFGHFLFEKKGGDESSEYAVIDGQQRLTTIIIYLSALFRKLRVLSAFGENERDLCSEMIGSEATRHPDTVENGVTLHFDTVKYDSEAFRSYVIHCSGDDSKGIETESKRRFIAAFNFFEKTFRDKDQEWLITRLNVLKGAKCSTYTVATNTEAVQMFLFENNRGKKLTNLEIVKAEFMRHIYAAPIDAERKNELFKTLKQRFESIYKNISLIEKKVNEDAVLIYALRVYCNSLKVDGALDTINRILRREEAIPFIEDFSELLAQSFSYLVRFYGEDEKKIFAVHSLITLDGLALIMPFILKAYEFNIGEDKLSKLCKSLEKALVRAKIVWAGANITLRLQDIYQSFTAEAESIEPIINRIEYLRTVDSKNDWWAYWNNDEFKYTLNRIQNMDSHIAKFLLWKYENDLRNQKNLDSVRFDKLFPENGIPDLEHIAPQTENEKDNSGYELYDEDFYNNYLNCLGNFLLISKVLNIKLGNSSFWSKKIDYHELEQQKEIAATAGAENWGKNTILNRSNKLVDAFLKIL